MRMLMNSLLEPAEGQGKERSCSNRDDERCEDAKCITQAHHGAEQGYACHFEEQESPLVDGGAGPCRARLLGHLGDATPRAVAGRPPEITEKAVGGREHESECEDCSKNTGSVSGHRGCAGTRGS